MLCAHGAIRTRDTRFRRAVLYPLSYVGRAVQRAAAVEARDSLADRAGAQSGI